MKFLVYDTGFATEHAARLVRDGHEVRYFTPWNRNYPCFHDYAIGLDFDGLDKQLTFFSNCDWADCIVFFDTGMGDLASFLRSKGYKVFGAGADGERLENWRYHARTLQNDLGLPTQPTKQIRGVTALKAYLKAHPNTIVKHDIFRGDMETLKVKDLATVEPVIDEYASNLGPFKDDMMFMVEGTIDGIEPGFDLFFNGKDWLKPFVYGYESKSAYIGKVSPILPPPLHLLASKLGAYCKAIDYRAAMSVEAMVTKDGTPYLIDFTARMPFPLSLIYTELIDNYSECIYKVACGEPVTPRMNGRYCGCLPLFADYAKECWLPVKFDKKDKPHIKFNLAAKCYGNYYVVPGMTNAVTLVYIGNSPGDVADGLTDLIGRVNAYDLDSYNAAGSLDSIRKSIEEGKKHGIGF